MAESKTLTFCIMDPPFEDTRSTTAMRLLASAVERGHNVRVFAYEGAVALPFSKQAPHPNAFHEHDVEEEDHPLPKEWVVALQKRARQKGVGFEWINCGLCVDERGVAEAVEGVQRGAPKHFWEWVQDSDNTLVIPTR